MGEIAFDICVTNTVIDTLACVSFVSVPEAGGVVTFTGSVRNATAEKRVTHLFYEAYVPMAEREMEHIARTMIQKYALLKVAIHHRIGQLEIAEAAVFIAVSAPHRKAAFAACSEIIDTLKQEVPIWKKEFFEDGSHWVSDRP